MQSDGHGALNSRRVGRLLHRMDIRCNEGMGEVGISTANSSGLEVAPMGWSFAEGQAESPFVFRAMPSLTILASSVVGLSPRISAAPPFPRTRQRVIFKTLNTCSRSASLSWRLGSASLGETFGKLMNSLEPVASIIALSTTFRTSRMLPGQEYRCSASRLSLSMDSMDLD